MPAGQFPEKDPRPHSCVSGDPHRLTETPDLFPCAKSVELIRDATGALRLLAWDGEKWVQAPKADHGHGACLPPDVNPSIARAVTLPTTAVDYGTTEQLFSLVQQSFANTGFPDEVSLPATYFAFSTLFQEWLPAAPCLLITGPRPEAGLLLHLLRCVVWHGLPLGQLTRAGLCSLPMDLPLTLLIGDDHLSPSLRRLLDYSNNQFAFVPWKRGVVNVRCAKAIYCGSAVGSRFGESALQINLPPTRMQVLGAKRLQQIAEDVQPRLLAYRSCNLAKVCSSEFDLPALDSATRILARVLGAPIVDAPELQAGIGRLLQSQHEKILADNWIDLRCVVVEALLFHCHSGTDRIYCREIANTASAILKGRGEIRATDPKECGGVIRLLGFSPKRDAKGSSIRLTNEVHRRVHRLARDYDVAAVQEGNALGSNRLEVLDSRDVQTEGTGE
jgi:hypothetical protein